MSRNELRELVDNLFIYMQQRLKGRLFAMAVMETVRQDVASGGTDAIMNFLRSQGMGHLFEKQEAA